MLAPQDLGTCPGPWIQWSWRASAAPSAVALDWSGVRAPALLALCDFDYLRGFHAAFYAILASAHLYFSNFSRCTPVFFAILVPAHLYFSRCAMRERARARAKRERERKIAKKSRKIAKKKKSRKNREKTRKNAKLRTAHDCSRIAKNTGVQALFFFFAAPGAKSGVPGPGGPAAPCRACLVPPE